MATLEVLVELAMAAVGKATAATLEAPEEDTKNTIPILLVSKVFNVPIIFKVMLLHQLELTRLFYGMNGSGSIADKEMIETIVV